MATRTKRVLTGYRPTGPLHVGHWAGNVENMLALQADPAYECFFFIADWHMLTAFFFNRRARYGLGTDRDGTRKVLLSAGLTGFCSDHKL